MKILFTNLLDTATLTAGGSSVNYPLANLQHPFLKRKFQQLVALSGGVMSDADALTLTWTTDQTIDFIAAGYTNATTLTLKLYDSADTLLDTQVFTSPGLGKSFTAVTGVRKAKVLMDNGTGDSPMTLYLGGLGIGQGYAMPDPFHDWKDELLDNSFGEITIDGQVSAQYIEPLRVLRFSFITADRTIFAYILAQVKALGKYTPLWILPFSDALATVPAMYATIPGGVENQDRDDIYRYTFDLTLQEAR